MQVANVFLYLAVLFAGAFLISGVLPAWRSSRQRRQRVATFAERYRRWVSGEEDMREWLVARRQEMQLDAMSVGRGVWMISPPPMIGGAVREHQMFLDLLSEQTFADMLIDEQTRLDELATIAHTLAMREAMQRRRLFNPFAWLRRAFERLIGLPRYLLKTAGFSERVADASLTRAVSVLWGFAVGAATIGGFVFALLHG